MEEADREAQAQRRRLRVLLVARVVAALVLLGSATVARVRVPGPHETDRLFLLLAVAFALAAVWTAAVRAMPARRWLVDAQMAADAVVVSLAVLLTGGLDSLLVPLYGLPVVAAAVLQYRRGGLLVAALNTLLYGAIIALQYNVLGLGPVGRALGLQAGSLPPVSDALLTLALNGAGFASVAWLTGYLAERVQHGDERLKAGLDPDRGPAGVQPVRHRQPDRRPGDDRSGRPGAHVESRGAADPRLAGGDGERSGRR